MTDTTVVAPTTIVQHGQLRSSAALAATGAYAATARIPLPDGLGRTLELMTGYTRGAEGGSWKARIEWYSVVAAETPMLARLVDEGAPTYSTPTMTVQEGDMVLQSPVASGAGAIYATRTLRVPDDKVAFRVSFAEVGVVATPGTLRAWYATGRAAS